MIEVHALDWLPIARGQTPVDEVAIEMTTARATSMTVAQATDMPMTQRISPIKVGYMAGTGDGILTLNGQPDVGEILCMDVTDKAYQWVYRGYSHKNGHWLIDELEPNRRYLVIARDVNKNLEAYTWDNVSPATDLTVAEQQALWQSWQ